MLIENNHLPWILQNVRPVDVNERDGDLMIDRWDFDAKTSRGVHERIVVKGGRVRRFPYFVRMFAFPELRDWLLGAGFADVAASGREGEELTLESRRMITIARR